MNQVWFGDNLRILRQLPSDAFSLIYADPPFNTKKRRKYARVRTEVSPDGDRTGFKGQRYKTFRLSERSYLDIFDDYLLFLEPRLREMYRVLAPNGTLYFHIDYREVHHCRILLDYIFGEDSFLNEVIWAYDYGGRSKKKWPAKHDNILVYVKDPNNYVFNTEDIDRLPYRAPSLVGPEKAERGKLPTDVWVQGKMAPADFWWRERLASEETNIGIIKGGHSLLVGPEEAGEELYPSDLWWHTIVPTKSRERTGYPTQKPLRLLWRIVSASSQVGDSVLDAFAGSGTTGVAAYNLDRRFTLVDNNAESIRITALRLADECPVDFLGPDLSYQEWGSLAQLACEDQVADLPASGHFYLGRGRSLIMSRKSDPGFEQFTELANKARPKAISPDYWDLWKISPIGWVRSMPPGSKGKLGKDLVSYLCSSEGLDVEKGGRSPKPDFFIEDCPVVVRMSTLWEANEYRFQQFKREQVFEYAICLGISPMEVHCWVIDRDTLETNATGQHGGQRAIDTFWLKVIPAEIDPWLEECGGELQEALLILRDWQENSTET